MDFFSHVGKIALGTRIRFLGEMITSEAAEIYKLYGIDMQPKWFPVFYMLCQKDSGTITSLAKSIGHSHVSVSKIVAEMIKAKIVTEEKKSGDRRRTSVRLSKAGQKIAEKIKTQYLDVQTAIDELSAQSRTDLWKSLEEWEKLLRQKSLWSRVQEKKILRESEGLRIVPYQAEHQTAFYKLNEEWIQTYFKMEKPDYEALENPQEYILDRGGYIFVALLGAKPVGVCALLKRGDKKYPYELAKMAVSPAAQGRNIGWLLGTAVADKARSLKAERLFLESNTILKPAIGLYHKLGFKKVTGPQTPYARCNIQMELEL